MFHTNAYPELGAVAAWTVHPGRGVTEAVIMGRNLEGSIPQTWWHADAKNQVLGYLVTLRVPARIKQQLLYNWATVTNTPIDAAELAYVLGRATRAE